YTIFVKIDCAR
ncbi:unnamed protein product, partial [Adineta ricciae]